MDKFAEEIEEIHQALVRGDHKAKDKPKPYMRKRPYINPYDPINCIECGDALNGQWRLHNDCLTKRIKEQDEHNTQT